MILPSNLKKLVAAYHGVATSALTVDGVDLFLAACNNAQEAALQKHNFEAARVTAQLSIDGETGGRIADAAIIQGGNQNSITASGTLSPDVSGLWNPIGLDSGGHETYALFETTSGFLFSLQYSIGGWEVLSEDTGVSWSQNTPGTTPAGTYTPAGGGITGTLTIAVGNSGFTGMREIVAISRSDAQGHAIPLDYTNPTAALERDRYQLEMSDNFSSYYRFPSDADILNRTGNGTIINRGQTLFIYPHSIENTSPVVILIEGYGQLADIVAANLTDTQPPNFLFDKGAEWLQWSIICELNIMFKTFVPRTEGNLAQPDQQRELAWQRLMVWDSYLVDNHNTRSR